MYSLASKNPLFALTAIGLASALVACSGDSGPVSVPVAGPVVPVIPAAQSAIVPPELTVSCPITNSSIDSLSVKGTGSAFNGATFGAVGTYTYYLAEATGKVKPSDPCAATIVDLKNTVPDAAGDVSYKFDVILLTPTDPAKANGTLFYEVTNRTSSLLVGALNDGTSNDLFLNTKPVISAAATGTSAGAGAGNGFLMNLGTSIVWAGWQGDRPQTITGPSSISATTKWYAPGMTLPVAVDVTKNNAPITGVVQDEFLADNATTTVFGTYYKMAPNALATATLTVRKTPMSSPITVDPSLWTYTAGSGTAEGGNAGATGIGFVTINRAGVRAGAAYANAMDAGLDNGSLYQFNYTATEPKVMGLGFLATRDLVSYLRYGTADKAGNANPVANRIKTTMFGGISQSGRFVRDYLWQGFNTDAQQRKVFDGMLPLVGGSRKTYTNFRWAKPGDYSRQHEQHYTPGDQFPFAYSTINDPLTGKFDGLLKKCTEANTCPKVFQYDSPIEFGGARASLVATDGAGKDLAIPDNVRLFYSAGTQHSPSLLANNAVAQPDMTVNRTVAATAVSFAPSVVNASTPLVRALYLNLEGWVKGTAVPLPSYWPSVAGGTMAVPTSSPTSLGAPDLSMVAFTGVAGTPGLGFNGVYNTLTVNDYSVIPAVPSLKSYVVHLPKVDGQGNDIAGAKMPDSAVPLATFTNYSIRKSGFSAGEQNGLTGSQLAFAVTDAVRQVGDTRRSVQALYQSKAGYLAQVNAAVDDLVARGLLLKGVAGIDDATAFKDRAVSQTLQAGFALLP